MITATKRGEVLCLDEADADLADAGWYPYSPSRSSMRYARSSKRIGREDLHRTVARRAGLPVDGNEIDHINRNGLDNRRHNLRIASKQQNQFNVGPRESSTSGYKGVHQEKRAGGWVAQIRINKKQTHLGTFATAQLASAAYQQAALACHGEFAGPALRKEK